MGKYNGIYLTKRLSFGQEESTVLDINNSEFKRKS